jgi:hypothetical protein
VGNDHDDTRLRVARPVRRHSHLRCVCVAALARTLTVAKCNTGEKARNPRASSDPNQGCPLERMTQMSYLV